MRSYTLSVLSSLQNQSSNANVEKEIIKWVNTRLEDAGKDSTINSFQDSKIATAKPIIDLIDAIKPGVINYELLQEGGTYEVCWFHEILRFYSFLCLLSFLHRLGASSSMILLAS